MSAVDPKTRTILYRTLWTMYVSGIVPDWVKRLHIFMDNACSTNKNQYILGWAAESVQQGVFDLIRVSFLIAGHTKFAPDLLFLHIAQTFARSDVFKTQELGEIVKQYAHVVIDEGEKVQQWRDSLDKYSALPGIRELHDLCSYKIQVTT